MSPQIQYTPGKPRTFIAAKTFALGRTGVSLQRGMSFDYDGAILTIPGYAPIQMPELRGAVRQGWIVPAEEFDENDFSAMRPVAANMTVRNADGGNPMKPPPRHSINTAHVESEEREVQNVQKHASGVRTANTQNYRRGSENRALPGRFITQVEEQDARPVGRGFRTPAKQETNLEKTSVYEAISAANSVRIEPGQGLTRDEMVEQMDPEAAAQYTAEIAARRAMHVATPASMPVARQVGQIRSGAATVQREGMTVRNHVGGGVETADFAGTDVRSKEQVVTVEAEGMRFTNTNGPKRDVVRVVPATAKAEATAPVSIKGTEDTRRKIAKMMCPDFPDQYDFDASDRKKVARIQADFEDRSDVIRAIFAAENDAMKNRLLQEFPEAFAS